MNQNTAKLQEALNEVKTVIKGKDEIIKKTLATILAGGHILLEDIPGVGKTTLAMAISKVISLDYRRMQFTPDVLPSDIVGFSMYNNKTNEFEYKEGAILCNLFLADEINRTSPKTQSSLLEVMEEKQVTVDGVTRKVPEPFTVIATQNPLGSSGTQKLPESQLDRFMVCLSLGYPDTQDAVEILKNHKNEPLKQLKTILEKEDVVALRQQAQEVKVSDEMFQYLVALTEKTRDHKYLLQGASPRASVALLNMAKAMALFEGREFAIPEDVYSVIKEVFGHRVKLSPKGRAAGMNEQQVIEEIFRSVKAPAT